MIGSFLVCVVCSLGRFVVFDRCRMCVGVLVWCILLIICWIVMSLVLGGWELMKVVYDVLLVFLCVCSIFGFLVCMSSWLLKVVSLVRVVLSWVVFRCLNLLTLEGVRKYLNLKMLVLCSLVSCFRFLGMVFF